MGSEVDGLAARLDEDARVTEAEWGDMPGYGNVTAKLEREAAAKLREQAEELEARREDDKALAAYFDFHGAEHEIEDCPEDDTCRCQCSAFGKRMRELTAERARKGRAR